jgi:hypothetical protein
LGAEVLFAARLTPGVVRDNDSPPRLAAVCALRRAGGYFSCLARKSNQKKASPRSRRLLRFLALLGRTGGENRLKHAFAESPGPLCAAQRLRGHQRRGLAPHPSPLPVRGEGACVVLGGNLARIPPPQAREGQGGGGLLTLIAFEGAEQRRAGGGIRRKSALALFRRPPRGAAQGSRAATDFVGSPFFGCFLWRSKESNRPRGGERTRCRARRRAAEHEQSMSSAC